MAQNRTRPEQIIIRCTADEHRLIDEKVETSGLNRTDFIIKAITEKDVVVVEDLKEILHELKRQGVNLNQILRYTHNDIRYLPHLEEAIKNCNEIYQKLFEFWKQNNS